MNSGTMRVRQENQAHSIHITITLPPRPESTFPSTSTPALHLHTSLSDVLPGPPPPSPLPFQSHELQKWGVVWRGVGIQPMKKHWYFVCSVTQLFSLPTDPIYGPCSPNVPPKTSHTSKNATAYTKLAHWREKHWKCLYKHTVSWETFILGQTSNTW